MSQAQSQTLIEVKVVSHWFRGENVSETEAVRVLDEISLDIEPGTFVSFLGPSGCGKTTLLRIVNGLVKPSQGQVLIQGKVVHGPPPEVATVFQDHNLLPWRRALENVEFGLELMGVPPEERKERALKALRMVALEQAAKSFPYQLSGGMRQRVGLARALCLNPQILLMDEPFGALDAQTRETMQDLLLDIWEQDRKTVIFVTHDLSEAIHLSDRIIVFSARPGVVKADIRVDLPRPRYRSEREGPEVSRYRNELWHLLKPEVLASEGVAS